jgi:hypothetical protein
MASGEHRQRGVQYRGGTAQADPPPSTPPVRPVKRTWWVLPFTGGALAVIVAAAAVTAVLHASHSSGRAAAASSTAAKGPPMPSQMFPDALFRKLTGFLQARDETGFLGLASASARPAVKSWWDNLQKIGFTTGTVIPTAPHDLVRVDRKGDGTTVVLAGAHSPLDPADHNGKPDVPLTRYRIGLRFASPTATGQITSWQPLDDAPWDSRAGLYVRKDTHVVVAGLPGDSALVDQTVPIAEAAADYDLGLVNHVNPQDLAQQQGFVVFVSGNAAARNHWLTPAKQPSGWPPRFLAARVFQLPGPGTTPVDATSAGNIADGTTGGARVVVAPYSQDGNGRTPHSQTVTLVREFMLGILAAHNQALANGLSAIHVPSWPQQGLAVAVQILFEANNNPTPARYDFSLLTSDLRKLPARYKTGALPTGWRQLYGPPLADAENWNEVAASVYAYIELKHGMNQMFASAMLLYTRYAKPFGNVMAPGSKPSTGHYIFFTSPSVKAAWKAWLAGL